MRGFCSHSCLRARASGLAWSAREHGGRSTVIKGLPPWGHGHDPSVIGSPIGHLNTPQLATAAWLATSANDALAANSGPVGSRVDVWNPAVVWDFGQ